ncbi:MAG: DUF5606 domain-containing protein [Alistipes sp.]|nr:DUF5606 domain-containing protein [Alistipes sp.]MBQ5692117.1 DUF5606 domain-containing protein [Alistipes sp.]
MELKDILAISGQPGLYRYIAQSRNGFIVESLIDGKRANATASSRVSALSEISMYTEGEDIPLAEVFTKMFAYTDGKQALSHKESDAKLKEFFGSVITDYDRERVHTSDIKKAIAWFNLLVGAGMTEFTLPEEEEIAEE